MRIALSFMSIAYALSFLPACSDEAGTGSCDIECDDCYTLTQAGDCYCVDLVDDDSNATTPPVCPL